MKEYRSLAILDAFQTEDRFGHNTKDNKNKRTQSHVLSSPSKVPSAGQLLNGFCRGGRFISLAFFLLLFGL
jgi:hypothetical protein